MIANRLTTDELIAKARQERLISRQTIAAIHKTNAELRASAAASSESAKDISWRETIKNPDRASHPSKPPAGDATKKRK